MDKHKKKGGEGEKAIIRVQENEKGLKERSTSQGKEQRPTGCSRNDKARRSGDRPRKGKDKDKETDET